MWKLEIERSFKEGQAVLGQWYPKVLAQIVKRKLLCVDVCWVLVWIFSRYTTFIFIRSLRKSSDGTLFFRTVYETLSRSTLGRWIGDKRSCRSVYNCFGSLFCLVKMNVIWEGVGGQVNVEMPLCKNSSVLQHWRPSFAIQVQIRYFLSFMTDNNPRNMSKNDWIIGTWLSCLQLCSACENTKLLKFQFKIQQVSDSNEKLS